MTDEESGKPAMGEGTEMDHEWATTEGRKVGILLQILQILNRYIGENE